MQSVPLVVSYSTSGGTATPDVDYVAVAATNLTFLAGSTSQNVTLQLIGDTLQEGDEYFGASFQLIYNDTVQSTATANVTILDDDVRVSGAPMGGSGEWAPATYLAGEEAGSLVGTELLS